MKGRRGPAERHRRLADDDRGVFPVVEAILVAVLVLTAIIFFTSVQRPTTAAEEGGLDLGQVAADTLRIMQSSKMGDSDLSLEEWVTALVNGDTTVAATIHQYLAGTTGDGILPKGARYQLRLDNGATSLPILPAGGPQAPRGAQAAHIILLPDWRAYASQAVGPGLTVSPGEVVPASHSLVDGTYACYQAPTGSVTAPDGPDADRLADTWASHWRAAPGSAVPWKASAIELGANQQIPTDLPFGRWRLSTTAATGTPLGCTGGSVAYADVVPEHRSVTATRSLAAGAEQTLTLSTGSFSDSDVGRTVTGTGLGSTARITAVTGPTTATISAPVTSAGTGAVEVAVDSTYVPYSLELVVWFGA